MCGIDPMLLKLFRAYMFIIIVLPSMKLKRKKYCEN